jgi:SAM-dependent methyltransferase
MIRRAQEKYGSLGNVNFQVEDVISLPFDKESFDVVISQRCLINLTSWLDQMKAIHQIHRVVKPGGFFILQEGSRQGRECLNQAREMLGLMRMPTVEYNLDFDEETLWPFLRELFDIVDVRRFGLYDLISRVVHPLQVSPEEPKYDAKINEVAAKVCARMHGAEPMAREFSAVMRRPVKM